MAWLSIQLSASAGEAPALADALETCGALAVTISGATDEHRLQSAREATPLWDRNHVTGLFPADTDVQALHTALCASLGADQLFPSVAVVEDADWERAWMAHYRPLQIAPGLWVCPSWCAPPDPDAVNLILDPGLAFGTGTHPTTALCLAWLAHQPLAGGTVLDFGCGSGILAIAALRLGAAQALGVDIDPQARAVSVENAKRNGVGDRYAAASPEELHARTFDVAIANILAPTLIALAPTLLARVGGGGRLALSGILREQAAEVRAAYAPHVALDPHERDGWVLLAGTRAH